MFLPYLTWTIRLLLNSLVTTLAIAGAAALWTLLTLPEPLTIDPVDFSHATLAKALLAVWFISTAIHVVVGPGVVSTTVRRHQEAVNHASAK